MSRSTFSSTGCCAVSVKLKLTSFRVMRPSGCGSVMPVGGFSTGSRSTVSSRLAASFAVASERQFDTSPATGCSAFSASMFDATRPPTVIHCSITETAPTVTTTTENTVSSTVVPSRAVSIWPFLLKLSVSHEL
jgi:hypothetical protein